MAEKSKRSSFAGKIAWLRGPGRTVMVVIVVLAAAAYGLGEAWKRWGHAVLASEDYVVTPEQILVSPQPDWIHADIKAEVIRDSSLSRLDVRDRAVLERVGQAFALHSWVARVKQVRKSFPARIAVDLEYRQPVAMVEVTAQNRPGLLFVDAASILLPSEDFAANQARDYLRISAGNIAPAGVYGTPWGSELVAGAARLAAAWGDRWQAFNLYRIVIGDGGHGQPLYELQTQDGRRVIWGRAPGSELSGEPGVEAKIARLTELCSQQGGLSSDDRPLDLSRNPNPLPVSHQPFLPKPILSKPISQKPAEQPTVQR
jgi:hypothetical protein